MLGLNCVLLLGNYYAYDNPSALNPLLRQYLRPVIDDDAYQYLFGLLYSVYSLPNILLPFVSGYLVDRLGTAWVLMVFSFCVTAGQILFTIGVSLRSVPLMILGRVLFGIGGESIAVAQSCITTRWFLHAELGLALGLNLAVPRVGSVLNSIMSPWWGARLGVVNALWVGAGWCAMSWLSACILVFIIGTDPTTNIDPITETVEQKPTTLKEELLNVIRSIHRSFSLFPREFWLLCIIVFLIYGTIIPFNTIVIPFLLTSFYRGDCELAGRLMSIPDSVCAILVPVCGLIVDRWGRRGEWLMVCTATMGIVHVALSLMGTHHSSGSDGGLVSLLVLLGIGYSIYGVAFWSSVACLFAGPTPATSAQGSDDLVLEHAEFVDEDSPLLHQEPSDTSNQQQRRLLLIDRMAQSTITTTSELFSMHSPLLLRKSLSRLSTTSLPILAASRALKARTAGGGGAAVVGVSPLLLSTGRMGGGLNSGLLPGTSQTEYFATPPTQNQRRALFPGMSPLTSRNANPNYAPRTPQHPLANSTSIPSAAACSERNQDQINRSEEGALPPSLNTILIDDLLVQPTIQSQLTSTTTSAVKSPGGEDEENQLTITSGHDGFMGEDEDKQRLLPPTSSEGMEGSVAVVGVGPDEGTLAIAYGLSSSAMNLALTLIPLLTAAIQRYAHHQYELGHPDVHSPDNGTTASTPYFIRALADDDDVGKECPLNTGMYAQEFTPVLLFFAAESFLACLLAASVTLMDRKWGRLRVSHLANDSGGDDVQFVGKDGDFGDEFSNERRADFERDGDMNE